MSEKIAKPATKSKTSKKTETTEKVAKKPTNKKSTKSIDFNTYSIFQTGGKQYQAIANKTIAIEKLDAAEGDSVTFSDVLLRKTSDDKVEFGYPFLKTPIKATVVKHSKGPKVIAFKFKRRKKYMRKIGHRQPETIVRIDSI